MLLPLDFIVEGAGMVAVWKELDRVYRSTAIEVCYTSRAGGCCAQGSRDRQLGNVLPGLIEHVVSNPVVFLYLRAVVDVGKQEAIRT